MNDRLEGLFEAARKAQPDTSAMEEHFETRLMARIRERQAKSVPWYMLVWRMIPVFAVIATLTAICSISFNPVRSQDLFAAIANGQDDYAAGSFLTGE
jgi:hypothetical protein